VDLERPHHQPVGGDEPAGVGERCLLGELRDQPRLVGRSRPEPGERGLGRAFRPVDEQPPRAFELLGELVQQVDGAVSRGGRPR
jgi:hypothetical protein